MYKNIPPVGPPLDTAVSKAWRIENTRIDQTSGEHVFKSPYKKRRADLSYHSRRFLITTTRTTM